MNKYYTVKETAEILQCSQETVRRKLRAGLIKSVKFGGSFRIKEDDLKKYMKDGE